MKLPSSSVLVLWLVAAVAHAATINVTSSSGDSNDGSGCTLRDAIQAVNTATPAGQCPAGTGGNVVNTINIQVNSIGFSIADQHSTNAALPAVVAGRLLNLYGMPQVRTSLSVLSTCDLSHVLTPIFTQRLLEVRAGATVNVADVNFSLGCPGAAGGAIANYGTLYLVRSRLSNNSNASPNLIGAPTYFNGGAIYSGPDAQLSVSDATFDSNSGNGAVYVDSDPTTGYASVDRSTFVGNRGGGINNAGALAVTNTTFVNNLGRQIGGGILPFIEFPGGAILSTGFLNLSFASLRNNSIPVISGSSTELDIGANSTAWIKSTLFGTPAGQNTSNCYGGNGASVFWSGVSISDDATCVGGSNLVSTNTGLDANLADNGGSTQTLKLLVDSPAFGVDADCLDSSATPVTIDQRGFNRPLIRCDAGAYEDTIFANGFE